MTNQEIYIHRKHNFLVNVCDGAFFGMALGFASFTTVIPLFVSTLTQSAILIGLIPAIHNVGWQLPQLFFAKFLTGYKQFKPFVLLMTIQERVPFLGLAAVAWLLPGMDRGAALWITFLLLIIQGLGGGFTANAWQVMIGKVIPSDQRSTFFGIQSAGANLFSSVGAIIAGFILNRFSANIDFALCFLLASAMMVVSWCFLASTREPTGEDVKNSAMLIPLWQKVWQIIQQDVNFRWFLMGRIVSQFGLMAFSFYIVYAVRFHGMNEVMAGVMASVLMLSQVAANPILGWLADKWSKQGVMICGSIATLISCLLAAMAPDLSWFFVVFILAGWANTTFWTISLSMSLDFGPEEDRPTYIGMSNTLIAPAAILAPLLGGWIADIAGYPYTFIFAAGFAVITGIIFIFLVRDPKPSRYSIPLA